MSAQYEGLKRTLAELAGEDSVTRFEQLAMSYVASELNPARKE